MATLRAAVEIQDRASTTFDRMILGARRFEERIDRIGIKLTRLEYRLDKLSRKSFDPKLTLDDSAFQSQLARAEAEMAAVGASRVAPDLSLGSGATGRSGNNSSALRRARQDAERDLSFIGKLKKELGDLDVHWNKANNGAFGFFSVLKDIGKTGFAIFNFAVDQLVQGGFRLLSDGFLNLATKSSLFEKPLFSVASGLEQLGPAIGGIAGPVGAVGLLLVGATVALGGLAQAIMVVAAAITSLLVPLAAVLPTVAAMGGGIFALLIPMGLWLKDTKKLTDEKHKLEQRLKTLTPGTKAYENTLNQLHQTTKKLNATGGAGVWDSIVKSMHKLKDAVMTTGNKQIWGRIVQNATDAFNGLLPIVGRTVTAFSHVGEKLSKALSGSLSKGGQGNVALDRLFRTLPPIFDKATRALGQFALLLINIATAAAPIANVMLKQFGDWLAQINNNLGTKSGLDGLRKWFADMYPLFKDMVIAVGQFVVGFVKLGTEGAPIARRFMSWLMDNGPKLVDAIKNLAKTYGPVFDSILQTLGRLGGVVIQAAKPIVEALLPVFVVLFQKGGIVDTGVGFISDLLSFFDKIGVDTLAIDAFKLLAGALQLINDALKGIRTLFQWIEDHVADIVNKILGPIGSLASAVGAVSSAVSAVNPFDNSTGPGTVPTNIGGSGQPLNGTPSSGGVPTPGDARFQEYKPRNGGNTFHIAELHVQAGDAMSLVNELERLAPITPVEQGSGPSGP